MKIINWVFLLILFICSCEHSEYRTEAKYENGQDETIFKILPDTVIFGTHFSRTYKIHFFENGDTLRKGVFLNNHAYGRHLFYKNTTIDCEREYIVPDPFFLEIDSISESIDWRYWIPKKDSTHLNTVIFKENYTDTIKENSVFYTMDIENMINDSVKGTFEFFFAGREIILLEVHAKTAEFDNIQIIRSPGNKFSLLRQRKEGGISFEFLVQMLAFKPEDKKMTGEHGYDESIMLIQKHIQTQGG